MGYGRDRKLDCSARIVPAAVLFGAVKDACRKTTRVVGKEDSGAPGTGVTKSVGLQRPQNRVGSPVGRNGWRRSRKAEVIDAFIGRGSRERLRRICDGESLCHIAYSPKIYLPIEINRRTIDGSPKDACELLHDIRITRRVVMPHIVPVDHANNSIFSRMDQQMGVWSTLVRKNRNSARGKITIIQVQS